ncbi:MAG: hypothetical protein P1U87_05345 [Verrucomicrobiales bacterium]|nr:hypothetical protein [Verrucomicrobiales bacterium]
MLLSAGSIYAAELATFSVDVTPPVGHQLFTGGGKESVAVNDPLFAKGFVLSGAKLGKPVVFVSVDWSEIRNDAFDHWRDALADAVDTDRARVFVSAIHQHDTPLADLTAQRILEEAGAETQLIDLKFHEETLKKVAAAAKEAWKNPQTISHFGTGKAKAEELASNRRFVNSEGEVSYGRGSSGNLPGRIAPVGTIDPWVKTLSFWDGEDAVCALSIYATHPMSYYRTQRISADFPGMARAARQEKTPETLQIYASGASGNVTVGKFNNGQKEMRALFADRLEEAMTKAWENTTKHKLTEMSFRSESLTLAPQSDGPFTEESLRSILHDESKDRMTRGKAALGLSWQKRCASGQPIDVPLLELEGGKAQLLLLPAEIYVEYQLAAEEMGRDSFVLTAGYGESGPGYIPTEKAESEGDSNIRGWSWIAPGQEGKVLAVLEKLLRN